MSKTDVQVLVIAEEWPNPEPLGGKLPSVMAFDLEFLPRNFRGIVEDTAERMSVPVDFPAILSIVSLAGVVNRRAFVQPKQFDDTWKEALNLWGATVGLSGMLKTPVTQIITKPHEKIEAQWATEHTDRMARYKAELAAWESRHKGGFDKSDEGFDESDPRPTEPTRKRLKTTDATPEKLQDILSQNPEGIFVLRDELSGWLDELDKKGRESERTFFLEGWNGNSNYTIDRIGRGTVSAILCITMFGTFQPDTLRKYFSEDRPTDGMVQRFSLFAWPDPIKRKNVDRLPAYDAINLAERVFTVLAQAKPHDIFLRFDAEAQKMFNAWLDKLEAQIESELFSPKRSHISKYRGLMPKLAGLFQLADQVAETGAFQSDGITKIDVEHADQAIQFIGYLKSHLDRLYSITPSLEQRRVETLAGHICRGDLGEVFTTREATVKHWQDLRETADVEHTLELLQDMGWVRRETTDTTDRMGRSRKLKPWRVNPKVFDLFKDGFLP